MPGLLQLSRLPFADDIVLLSDTPIALQNQLTVLNLTCKDLFLNVNTDKTKKHGIHWEKEAFWEKMNIAVLTGKS